ncbi:MAG: hypothetical protein LBJ32_01880, partial [Oscillospiraceae bacterium]|nr:hypothetical protein [Oscillospiraceae bacterium]
KKSIDEIPVTISGLINGKFVKFTIELKNIFLEFITPRHAAVPKIAAIIDAQTAIINVLAAAWMICESLNKTPYQSSVQPFQIVLDLEALNEDKINKKIGEYKSTKTAPVKNFKILCSILLDLNNF